MNWITSLKTSISSYPVNRFVTDQVIEGRPITCTGIRKSSDCIISIFITRAAGTIAVLAVMAAFIASTRAALADPYIPDIYKVSVVIFENLDPQINEAFNVPVTISAPAGAKVLTTSSPVNESEVRLLENSKRGLQPHADAISKSSNFRLHSHLSWLVKLPDNRSETFVIPTLINSEHSVQLSGHINIRRARFLHLAPKLLLTQWQAPPPAFFVDFDIDPLAQALSTDTETSGQFWHKSDTNTFFETFGQDMPATSTTDMQSEQTVTNHPLAAAGLEPVAFYQLRNTRRMRSNRLHYLDHPRLAMLAEIEKIEVVYQIPARPAENPGKFPEQQASNGPGNF